MNKVILMGRLTRDPEVRYPQGKILWRLPDIRWLLTAVSGETERQPLILSAVWLSEDRQNLQRDISVRESVL